ncbi:lipopolysaccharide biosynthesis protein RfbH [Synechococcus sp. MVIR-18-1]|uniref:lipopolysaccharide biosynthesis protein RfbH n=1 Tax=Synechococcus sp. MVIR-18-1 TaxID=1386941 RepID=UPI001646430F|nr:lipopolysaccharide biosynthesis protein RfbH [Synechococcus sp. MVIR-18-1]QNI75162.1 CDP-4-dehydro-6-deoxyglucose reductase [Synechococcus sp. MVIR-18-1]
MSDIKALKDEILRLTREYSRQVHSCFRPADDPIREPWKSGSPIPYAGRVFTEDEVAAAVGSTLDFWLTLGNEGESFQNELAEFMGVRKSLLVNSGSSANLVAISALTSYKLPENRRIKPGDEVITVAAGFPTTVAPIVQIGAVPVFIDADPITGNAQCDQLQSAYTPGVTKAVMMAHALGNPFDLATTLSFCRKYDLWLIEDNCDALGCSYSMPRPQAESLGFSQNSPGLDEGPDRVIRWTGTWGDISTQSFYPPHHLTMGEGGAVNIVSDQKLKVIAESFRDWGRDCWCPSGIDNTCNKRFDWQLGELPAGYDHKYTYSHLGYNLKPLDPQAAIGRIQLNRLPEFIEARKKNWETLRKGLSGSSEFIEFSLPTHATDWSESCGFSWDKSGCRTDCSWFGFKIAVRESADFSRTDLARELDEHKIGNRMLFGGNLLRQPAFVQLRSDRPESIRVVGDMCGSDEIMNTTLFLGTFPGLTSTQLKFEIDVINNFISERRIEK